MRTLVCLGDSLTQGADIAAQHTWPALTANLLSIRTINKGIGGDTSAGLLSRFYPDVVHQRADMVLILGGTNDLWWDLEIKLILANLFTIACQAQHHNIAPVLGTPLPLHPRLLKTASVTPPPQGTAVCMRQLTELSQRIMDMGTQYEIPHIDYHPLFHNDRGEVSGKYYLEDGLHLNRQGHRLMAQATADHLKRAFLFTS